jgi:hypothetical protein
MVYLYKNVVTTSTFDRSASEVGVPSLWFTEGFDTADLKDAKVLLDQLGS